MVFITGGQKSGKSTFAEELILELCPNKKPKYLATAKVSDEEMKLRIEKHKTQRGDRFVTIEEPLELSSVVEENDWVLVECLTLWLSQIYSECLYDYDKSLKMFELEFLNLTSKTKNLVIVGNEIGSGLHPMEESVRSYVDLQGIVNQRVAKFSKQVYLIISGCSLKIKG